jgi:hypothetical protein
MTQPTEKLLSMLRHMLGINTPWHKDPRPHRNYAAATPGDEMFIEMERMGLVENTGRRWEYDCYICTDAGKEAAMQSYKNIRWSKAKRKYQAFLDLSDCLDITFKEFLVNPEFAGIRRDA